LNPDFSSVGFYTTDFVSRYEALQLDVKKRFSRGFTLDANYTFSKLEDDFGANHCDNCGASTTNPFNRASIGAFPPRTCQMYSIFQRSGKCLA